MSLGKTGKTFLNGLKIEGHCITTCKCNVFANTVLIHTACSFRLMSAILGVGRRCKQHLFSSPSDNGAVCGFLVKNDNNSDNTCSLNILTTKNLLVKLQEIRRYSYIVSEMYLKCRSLPT